MSEYVERRFQPLLIKEPTVIETISILQSLSKKYAVYHGVSYSPESLEAAAKLSERYIPDRFLPDKAIDLIDGVYEIIILSQIDFVTHSPMLCWFFFYRGGGACSTRKFIENNVKRIN